MKFYWCWFLFLTFLGYALTIILSILFVRIVPSEELNFRNPVISTIFTLLFLLTPLGIYIFFKKVVEIKKIVGLRIFTAGYIIPLLLLFYSSYIAFLTAAFWSIIGGSVIDLLNIFRIWKKEGKL